MPSRHIRPQVGSATWWRRRRTAAVARLSNDEDAEVYESLEVLLAAERAVPESAACGG